MVRPERATPAMSAQASGNDRPPGTGLPEQVYLSFDIDGLDPVLCPHTGTPVPGGLSFAEATALIAGVVRSGRTFVGFDLNEVAPDPDGFFRTDNHVSNEMYMQRVIPHLTRLVRPGRP